MIMIKNLRKNKKGFTLIELIVVIAILAILAAIAVPRVMGFQDAAKTTANQQTSAQIKNAVAIMMSTKQLIVTTATTANDDVYIIVDGDTAAAMAVTYVANGGAGDSSITQPANTNMDEAIKGFITDYSMKTIGGASQKIVVRIKSTEVKAVVVPDTTSTTDETACRAIDWANL